MWSCASMCIANGRTDISKYPAYIPNVYWFHCNVRLVENPRDAVAYEKIHSNPKVLQCTEMSKTIQFPLHSLLDILPPSLLLNAGNYVC